MVCYDLAAAEVASYVVEDALPLGSRKKGEQAFRYHQCGSVVGEVFQPARFRNLERSESVVTRRTWDQASSRFDHAGLIDVDPSNVGVCPHTQIPTV